MNTNQNKRNAFFAIAAIALMTGSGILFERTINEFYNTLPALAVISLSLLSILTYILGASLMGRCLQKENRHQSCGRSNHGILFAFLLIAGGLLLLCFNTELLNPVWKKFFFSWPMLLFAIGAINICRNRFTSGVIIGSVGYFFLMEKAARIYPGNFTFELSTATYWPTFIIVIGVLILAGTLIGPGWFRRSHPHKGSWKEPYTTGENENNDGKINYQFVFSGTEQVILDPVFKGGTIDATFGGMELDLRRTSLAEGDTFLYIKTVFGGVEITAPDHWDIEIHSKGFVGGVSDSRIKNIDKDRTKKLIIIAKFTFGGIEIK